MSLSILGLGVAQPELYYTQERAAELISLWSKHDPVQTRRLATLYSHTGILRRHVIIDEPAEFFVGTDGPPTSWRMNRYDERIRPLALAAAGRALEASGVPPEAFTHLVTVSCTGFATPGFDFALIEELGLPRSVQRTHVGFMGCHGALNGLRVARAFTASEPEARVLLCAAELCSLHFRHGTNSEKAVINALFADGAAALVGASEAPSRPAAWRATASGSYLLPDSSDAMAWKIGDFGFDMGLLPSVPGLIERNLGPWLVGWLGGLGLGLDDVGSWAIHPGGPLILDSIQKALHLDEETLSVSREVLAECGNMSSPTVLFILDRLRRRSAPLPCVALAFGPGLVIEAALFS
jgi:predicted naringenin-chalcone synthase